MSWADSVRDVAIELERLARSNITGGPDSLYNPREEVWHKVLDASQELHMIVRKEDWNESV